MRVRHEHGMEYTILTDEGFPAGLLSFKVDYAGIHIHNVYVHNIYKKDIEFTAWLKTFPEVFAYDVVPDAVSYWKHISATIVNIVGTSRFEDMVIEKEDYEIFD